MIQAAFIKLGTHAISGLAGALFTYHVLIVPHIDKKIDTQTNHIDKRIDQLIDIIKD